ncbi:hypothetical protein [Burkholderia sp. Bp9012]|nr:hypothetical protein [Burkholderia sp. Bp9012]
MAAQQLIAGIGVLTFKRISRIALDVAATVFPLLPVAASGHFP